MDRWCFDRGLWGLVFGKCLIGNGPSGFNIRRATFRGGQMRKIGVRGFQVVQDGKGKATLERIPFYGRDASAKIRGKKSKKATVVRPSPDSLWGKGKTT